MVLAIVLPRMFASLERGKHVDNSVMALGYRIMRIAMVFQRRRATRQDPARRRISHLMRRHLDRPVWLGGADHF
jgi:hypothetical protein